jgi:hypothetical protein
MNPHTPPTQAELDEFESSHYFPAIRSHLARLTKEVEELRKDKERLNWLERLAKSSLTGVTLDWVKHAENGRVVESGYRVLARFFQSERKPDVRQAINSAMQQKGEE